MARKILAVLVALTMISGGLIMAQNTKPNPNSAATLPDKPPEAPKAPTTLPADATGLPLDPKTYVIGPEDIINVKVWREQDFTGAKAVRPDGKISLPLIHDIQAAGLTPARLSEQIAQALGTYLKDPQVEIEIVQVNSKSYTMSGGVQRPGKYPLVTPTTVFEAINNASGFRDFANEKDIVILRANGERLHFNYKDFVKHGETQKNKNVLLENGDTVLVKE